MQPAKPMSYKNLTTAEVKQKLDGGDTFRLIDVREIGEHAIARIDGAELLPLSSAQRWIQTLYPDEEIVIFCHHGGRSQQVANYLAAQLGFPNVANMLGGIDEWSRRIDQSIPRY